MGFAPGPGQGGTSSIAGSSDVSLNSPQNDQILAYSSSSSKWANRPGTASRYVYPILANANGTWPTFQSAYPAASLPLPDTSEVTWIKRSNQSSIALSAQYEEIGSINKVIGGVHSVIVQSAAGGGGDDDAGSRVVPHVLGLTYNGLRESNAQQALRIPFVLPRNATRWRLSLAPGLQDAEERTLDVSGVTLVGAVLGRHSSGGVMTEALHSFGSQDMSSGAWLSPWINKPLTAGDQLVLSYGYNNPSGRQIAAGSMGVYRSTTASDFSNIGGSSWTKDHMVRGPMSPVIIYETPGNPKVVAVAGDSNAAGRGTALPYHESFSHVTGRRLGQIVVPLGYTGETLSDYYEPSSSPKWTRIRDLCGGSRWDGVIIQAGINDVNINRPVTHLQTSMPQVVAQARQHLADTVYAATLPPATFDSPRESVRNAYNNWLKSTTPPANLDGIVDLATPVTNSSSPSQLQSVYNSGDNIHYNAAGHAAMSSALDAMINSLTGGGSTNPPGPDPDPDPDPSDPDPGGRTVLFSEKFSNANETQTQLTGRAPDNYLGGTINSAPTVSSWTASNQGSLVTSTSSGTVGGLEVGSGLRLTAALASGVDVALRYALPASTRHAEFTITSPASVTNIILALHESGSGTFAWVQANASNLTAAVRNSFGSIVSSSSVPFAQGDRVRIGSILSGSSTVVTVTNITSGSSASATLANANITASQSMAIIYPVQYGRGSIDDLVVYQGAFGG